MKLIVLALLLAGCSTFRSDQIQTKADGTKIESHQLIRNFWDAHSDLAKLRASTTDKTQGLTVGGYESDVQSTNVNALVSDVVGAAVSAAIKSTVKP